MGHELDSSRISMARQPANLSFSYAAYTEEQEAKEREKSQNISLIEIDY